MVHPIVSITREYYILAPRRLNDYVCIWDEYSPPILVLKGITVIQFKVDPFVDQFIHDISLRNEGQFIKTIEGYYVKILKIDPIAYIKIIAQRQ